MNFIYKGIVNCLLINFVLAMNQENNYVEKDQANPNDKIIFSLQIPPENHFPAPEHGPHSQAGIVCTMDAVTAVNTSTSTHFIKAF
jgi:hypothetical protein